jgi:cytidylate kinase
MGRDIAPLQPADESIIVTSDGLDVSEVVARLLDIVSHAWRQPAPT